MKSAKQMTHRSVHSFVPLRLSYKIDKTSIEQIPQNRPQSSPMKIMFIFLINRFIVSCVSRKIQNFSKLARSFLIGATCRIGGYRLVHVHISGRRSKERPIFSCGIQRKWFPSLAVPSLMTKLIQENSHGNGLLRLSIKPTAWFIRRLIHTINHALIATLHYALNNFPSLRSMER